MLDENDLARAEKLFRDDDAPERVPGGGARVSDHMRVSEIDAQRGGGVDPRVHAGDYDQLRQECYPVQPARRSRTRYFFAGGSARWPLSKDLT